MPVTPLSATKIQLLNFLCNKREEKTAGRYIKKAERPYGSLSAVKYFASDYSASATTVKGTLTVTSLCNLIVAV